MSISDAIKSARPSLSPSSVKTYTSVLSSLHKKVFGSGEIHLKDFDQDERIIHFLKSKPASARKSVLAALVVLTGNEVFRKAMAADCVTFAADIAKQENTPKQRAAEISQDEIKAIFDRLSAEATLLYNKKHRTVSDLLLISDYVILALMSGIFIPPRRALDFTAFKIKEINPAVDNYLEKNELVFNQYKTARTYGKQTVSIPPALKAILLKYSKINPTDFLLFDSKFKPLTSVTLNQRLCRIFNNRKIAVNSLRHSYLTSKYTSLSKEQKLMEADVQQMGTSPGMLSTYVKLS
jgi:hypothetical protein